MRTLFENTTLKVTEIAHEGQLLRSLWFCANAGQLDAVGDSGKGGEFLPQWTLQGTIDMHAPQRPQLAYIARMTAAIAWVSPERMCKGSAWLLGLGVGSLAHAVWALQPSCDVHAVEIDPAVAALYDEFFQSNSVVSPGRNMTVHVADMLVWINSGLVRQLPAPLLIFLDAYVPENNQFAVPSHSLDRSNPDFYQTLSEQLDPDGVLVVNLHAQQAFAEHLQRLDRAFTQRVRVFATETNPVVYAFGKDAWTRFLAKV